MPISYLDPLFDHSPGKVARKTHTSLSMNASHSTQNIVCWEVSCIKLDMNGLARVVAVPWL